MAFPGQIQSQIPHACSLFCSRLSVGSLHTAPNRSYTPFPPFWATPFFLASHGDVGSRCRISTTLSPNAPKRGIERPPARASVVWWKPDYFRSRPLF
jgi:hypothetical protein